ncbi:MAG TPA: MarR family winged helix-turn-helix transcriptional regulator [Nitrospira sp.]|nr:MarR family winged helix-turn-helix transcriptional regulator [Nitrospira sp.]
MKHFLPPHQPQPLDHPGLRQLANFRYQLRKFLRFSERAARSNGLTPQQHQLLLGIAGYTGQGWATITELAEFLQERHNAVVGLVQRAERCGLVRKEQSTSDHRFVRVSLLPKGERILAKLTDLHEREVRRCQLGILNASGSHAFTTRKNSKKNSSNGP